MRTMEVLLTSPVTETQIVLAKFAASMSLIVLMLVLSAAYPVVLARLWRSRLGTDLQRLSRPRAARLRRSSGSACSTSALTDNQIIAALLSLSVFLLLWIIDEYGYLLPDPFDALRRQPVALGAFQAVRDRIAVFFRCRLLCERGHAHLVP